LKRKSHPVVDGFCAGAVFTDDIEYADGSESITPLTKRNACHSDEQFFGDMLAAKIDWSLYASYQNIHESVHFQILRLIPLGWVVRLLYWRTLWYPTRIHLARTAAVSQRLFLHHSISWSTPLFLLSWKIARNVP
jgi:hypothetical protein